MSKHPNRNPISRRDIVRAVNIQSQHGSLVSMRLDDMEKIIGEYIEYKGDEKEFKKYLDGKYKSEDDNGSGTDSSSSEE